MISPLAPRTLWIGPSDWEEFADTLRALHSRSQVTVHASIPAARHYLEDHPADVPAVIVLATARPGVFRPTDIAPLTQSFVDVIVIQLLGSWCEGELRSGRPLLGIPRVYWHQGLRFLAGEERIRSLLGTVADGSLEPGQAEPRGFGHVVRTDSHVAPDRVVLVRADASSLADMLMDVCADAGYLPIRWRADQPLLFPPRAIVWDMSRARSGQTSTVSAWKRLRIRYPASRRIAVVDFPRLHEAQPWQWAGVSAVIAKPFSLEAMRQALADQPATRSPLTN